MPEFQIKENCHMRPPEINSFLLPSGRIRYHWIEQLEISVALST